MPVYSNTIADPDIAVALGSPTILAGDSVHLIEGMSNYTTNLTALGSTQFSTFMAGPGFSGNIGNFPNPMLVNASNIHLLSKSPLTAIKGTGVGTVAIMVWKNAVGGRCQISDYAAITRMDLVSSGKFTVLSTANATSVYAIAGGLSVNLEKGGSIITRLDVGVPSDQGGVCQALVGRDADTINVKARGIVETHDDCSPATVNIDSGTLNVRGGNVGAINISAGTVDFSKAPADVVVGAWVITGDCTIKRPPNGIAVNMPTSVQQGSFRINYIDAA